MRVRVTEPGTEGCGVALRIEAAPAPPLPPHGTGSGGGDEDDEDEDAGFRPHRRRTIAQRQKTPAAVRKTVSFATADSSGVGGASTPAAASAPRPRRAVSGKSVSFAADAGAALVDRIVNQLATNATIPADELADVGWAWLPNPAAGSPTATSVTPAAATPAPSAATPAPAAATTSSSARRVPVLSPLLVR